MFEILSKESWTYKFFHKITIITRLQNDYKIFNLEFKTIKMTNLEFIKSVSYLNVIYASHFF